MSKLRVLVTDADTHKALAIVRGLGDRHEVWTTADWPLALAAWSRYTRRHVTHSFKGNADFCSWVSTLCRDNRIQVVIPPEEASSVLLAREAARFRESGIAIASLPLDALEKVVDKTRTLEAAQAIGIRVPPTESPSDAADLILAARRLGYPVVIKPRSTQFWNGTRFVSSKAIGYATSDEQLHRLVRQLEPGAPPPIIQKFIAGSGVGVSMLIDYDGEILAEFAHRRLRDYRPTGSGSVLRESIALTPELRNSSARLLRTLGCHGIAMVEYRIESGSGDAYLMEINGRFWGSLQLAIDSGVNFPALLVDWVTGNRFDKPSYKTGVILRWWAGDLVRTLRVLKGRPAGFAGSFPSRSSALREFIGRQPKGTRNEILQWRDCMPSFIEPISVMRKLIA